MTTKAKHEPRNTVGGNSRYRHRASSHLSAHVASAPQPEGAEVTSSQELGELLGISSAQIRKDLSHFGEFGKQGTGYNVGYLCTQLEKILKVDCVWPVVLVGAGYLGHALASYNGFEHRGFRIVAVFDNDPDKIGNLIGDVEVQPIDAMPAVVHKYRCQIAIIAVPAAIGAGGGR